ncbi:MAG: FtsX-like permease family protein [Planctomycetota bacterium]
MMLRLTLINLGRRPVRTLLTALGVAAAAAAAVSLLAFQRGYQRAVAHDVSDIGFELMVTAPGCPYEIATVAMTGGAGLKYIDEELTETLAGYDEVREVTPFLLQAVRGPGDSGWLTFLGVDVTSYRSFKASLRLAENEPESRWIAPDAERIEIVLGAGLAEATGWRVEEILQLEGLPPLRVAGILEPTGGRDDGVALLDWRRAQELFEHPGRLTGIGLRLTQDPGAERQFEDHVAQLGGIQVVDTDAVGERLLDLVRSTEALLLAIAGVAGLIAALGVLNTIWLSVVERIPEIGVFRALGASRRDVFSLIWIESVLTCAAGGLIGTLFVWGAGRFIEEWVRSQVTYAPRGRLVQFEPAWLLVGVVGAMLLGSLGGILPAWRAAVLQPLEAIRSGE